MQGLCRSLQKGGRGTGAPAQQAGDKVQVKLRLMLRDAQEENEPRRFLRPRNACRGSSHTEKRLLQGLHPGMGQGNTAT